jgi:hypothetical protein
LLDFYSSLVLKFEKKSNQILKELIQVEQKSLYRSRSGRHFYGTENVIWAGFGPIGKSEKKVWADYEQLLRMGFSCFWVQKIFF